MLFFSYCATLIWLFFQCHGTPTGQLNIRQEPGTYYAITGATGGIHPRLEIRQLEEDSVMWNLFLLALRNFQAIDQNEIDSYYQIAGIHGMPWYDWDGVTFNTSNGRPPQTGYCPHHVLLFSTWHRPYILLFEQKLQSVAIEVANGFPDPSYQDAANRLRLPYWDWAQAVPADSPVIPAILSTPRVSITLQDNSTVEIDNPLYDYGFHPHDRTQINSTGCNFGDNPIICDTVQRTVRKATNAGRDVSNHDLLNADLRSQLPSLRQTVYSAITQYHSFNDLSTDGNCGQSPISSIESPHNNIHNAMDPGHMSVPAVAAFDPIFWLHHSNVDRQIALFQALFPETYVEQCTAEQITWTIRQGTSLDAQSPLTPFHTTTSGDWWTSANSRNIEDLGYTYPELVNTTTNETLISRINALYRDSRLAAINKELMAPEKDIEYIVQIRMPVSGKFSYNVVLFLGEIHEDPARWTSQNSFVGKTSSSVVMAAQRSNTTLGTIVLTEAVNMNILRGQIQQGRVVEYLKDYLNWRLELGEAEIPKNDIPGVKVTLMSTEVERATSATELDRWVGGFTILGDID